MLQTFPDEYPDLKPTILSYIYIMQMAAPDDRPVILNYGEHFI